MLTTLPRPSLLSEGTLPDGGRAEVCCKRDAVPASTAEHVEGTIIRSLSDESYRGFGHGPQGGQRTQLSELTIAQNREHRHRPAASAEPRRQLRHRVVLIWRRLNNICQIGKQRPIRSLTIESRGAQAEPTCAIRSCAACQLTRAGFDDTHVESLLDEVNADRREEFDGSFEIAVETVGSRMRVRPLLLLGVEQNPGLRVAALLLLPDHEFVVPRGRSPMNATKRVPGAILSRDQLVSARNAVVEEFMFGSLTPGDFQFSTRQSSHPRCDKNLPRLADNELGISKPEWIGAADNEWTDVVGTPSQRLDVVREGGCIVAALDADPVFCQSREHRTPADANAAGRAVSPGRGRARSCRLISDSEHDGRGLPDCDGVWIQRTPERQTWAFDRHRNHRGKRGDGEKEPNEKQVRATESCRSDQTRHAYTEQCQTPRGWTGSVNR
jgi:hypothetical protein